MQEKKTQNPSLSVTHETMHENQWKRTEKQRAEPQCGGGGDPSQREPPRGPVTSLSREELSTESWGVTGGGGAFLFPLTLTSTGVNAHSVLIGRDANICLAEVNVLRVF